MDEKQQQSDVNSGVPAWLVVGVVLVGVLLVGFPLWWLLDSYVFADQESVSVATTEPEASVPDQPTASTLVAAVPVNIALRKPVTGTGPGEDLPGRVVDGNPETAWNSGSYAPQLVEIDLEGPSTVHSIRLRTGQYPNGETQHVVFGLRPGETEPEVLHIFEGYTIDRQWLTYTPETPWEGFDRIAVGTAASPSWVAWFEIQVMGTQ